ncbi:MAG: hypothetical protein AAF961_18605, partial [Planctomycetota bacterium]
VAPSRSWRALTPAQGERPSRRAAAHLHPRAVDAALSEEPQFLADEPEERRTLPGGAVDQHMRSIDPAHGPFNDGRTSSEQQALFRALSSKLHEIQDQQEQIRQLLASVRIGDDRAGGDSA